LKILLLLALIYNNIFSKVNAMIVVKNLMNQLSIGEPTLIYPLYYYVSVRCRDIKSYPGRSLLAPQCNHYRSSPLSVPGHTNWELGFSANNNGTS